MPSLGTAYVAIKADIKTLKPGLDKARKTVGSSVDGMLNKISQITFRAAIVGAAAFSAAVVYNLKKSVDAASNLQEVTSKFETVFKNQIPIAEKWSKELVAGYAMSTREAKQYLSSVQDLLVPMGMQAEAAGRMSNEVVKLSADLASFNNVPTAQAMADIQSALVGNFETMKKYGVILNETVIKQEALAQGLWNGKGMVDANTKAQVAFELMLRGSAAALGDQQKTMGSYANQMKQLTANLEEIRAKIGESLLPALTEIVLSMNEWVKVNKELIGPEFKEWLEAVNPLFKVFAATASMLAQAAGGVGVMIGAIGNITPYEGGMKLGRTPESGAFGGRVVLGRTPESGAFGSDQTEKDTAQQEAIAKSLEIDALGKKQALAAEYIHWEQVIALQEKAMADSKKIRADELKGTMATQQQKYEFYADAASKISGTFLQIAQAGGEQSKAAFRVYQAAAMSEAIISAHSAIIKALGAYPPPYSFVAAGIAGAAAAVQVASIAAAKPPSYETGTDYVPETGLALLHKGEQVIPSNRVPAKTSGGGGDIILNNPTFQDQETLYRTMDTIAAARVSRDAPRVIFNDYNNDGLSRQMVRGGA